MQIADSVLEKLSVFYEIKTVTWKFTVFLLWHEESSDCVCVCVGSTKRAGGLRNSSSSFFQQRFSNAHNKGMVWLFLVFHLIPTPSDSPQTKSTKKQREKRKTKTKIQQQPNQNHPQKNYMKAVVHVCVQNV